MTEANTDEMHVTLHLVQQTTIEFNAADLWPLHGAYSRFGADLPSFAAEVTRRLGEDGYIGLQPDPDTITVIPISAVKRMDFHRPPHVTSKARGACVNTRVCAHPESSRIPSFDRNTRTADRVGGENVRADSERSDEVQHDRQELAAAAAQTCVWKTL
jgi:hypothetical protein